MTEAERQRLQQDVARSLPMLSDDPEAMKIARDARAENERAKREFHMQEKEILQRTGYASLEELDRDLSRLVNIGFPFRNDFSSAIIRTVRTNLLGKQVPSIYGHRHVIERWLEDLAVCAERMGYTKKNR